MKFSSTLQREIIDFLKSLPNIHDADSQRALIYHAGLESELQEQIPFGKPSAQFVPILVATLIKYGKLNDERYAIEAILQAAKDHVGSDKKFYCDKLIQKVRDNVSPIDKTSPHHYNLRHYKVWGSSIIVLVSIVIAIILYIIQNSPCYLNIELRSTDTSELNFSSLAYIEISGGGETDQFPLTNGRCIIEVKPKQQEEWNLRIVKADGIKITPIAFKGCIYEKYEFQLDKNTVCIVQP